LKLVFATNNKHKLKEAKAILGNSHEILSLQDIGCNEELAETGKTIRDNAIQKAQYVHEKYGVNCFADDTGLEIEALDGRPGVYSARYAGNEAIADKNIEKVLSELRTIANRKARFRTVIALFVLALSFDSTSTLVALNLVGAAFFFGVTVLRFVAARRVALLRK